MLKVDREKCVYCKLCEEVCSFRFTDAVCPSVAAIRIGREGQWGLPFARVCNLCEGLGEQKCIAVCPVDALTLGKNNGVVWDDQKCNRCQDCVSACPQEAVAFDEKGDRIILCDLCGGQPLCIRWCPENVISL
jgi:Fe-S-cluster-containing hydrogenase component 2